MTITIQTIALDDLPRLEWKRINRPLKTPTVFDFNGRDLDIQDGDSCVFTYDNRQWRGTLAKHGDGWRFIENIE